MKKLRIILFIICSLIAAKTFGQKAVIYGTVYDEKSKPVQFANISIQDKALGCIADERGQFELTVPANIEIVIQVSYVGYSTFTKTLTLAPDEKYQLDVRYNAFMLPEANVGVQSDRFVPGERLNPDISLTIPTMGGFEDMLKSFASVSSNNELSSQYSVRGGNFDENLVFVNDIEIYRPLLIRSGQQEGLSFINSDMVSSIIFSAGGFEAKYGDKMSSVLDIKYRKPKEFGGTANVSLLGANIHLEGTSKNHLFKYNTGFRYKSTKYILSSMDMMGRYDPTYLDFQAYLTYDVSETFELSFLGNLSNNTFSFIPEDRETSWGTLNEALKIKMYFEGQELDQFTNVTAAFTGTHTPDKDTKFKYIVSSYYTKEEETYDILGQYYLNELDKQLGSDNLGDSVANIGVGSFLNHARNYLDGYVFSAKYMAEKKIDNHKILWGAQYNFEMFDYRVKEWEMIDSAGYSMPYPNNGFDPLDRDTVPLFFTDLTGLNIRSNRFNAFVQESYLIEFDSSELSIGGGIRFNYWDFNNEFLFSPRFNIGFKPNWKKDIVLRISTGLYHQPPFFKEVRKLDGTLNHDIKAQSSFQVVIGSDYEFKAWNRPFKLVTEAYYKYMYNLIPYDVDNVRIRYYGENIASGYSTGIEAKVNGEFVPGTESWISIGVMQTREDIEGDSYVQTNDDGSEETIYPGFIPRPTDQRVNFGIFFQDYIPKAPSWQVSLNLLFGTGLPFGPPNSERYMATGRMNPYRRVDLGLSKRLLSEEKKLPESNPFRHFKSIWLRLEVFNLLDINNTISHTWVTDIRGWQYAVPNYLTGRRVNLRLIVKF